ncbi:MAG: glycosyltransferase [Candidatus Taylorbacteria bacterium]
MKIIALIPIKNEAWILKTCLSSLKKYTDEIIVMDDNSTDESVNIAQSFGATIYKNDTNNVTYFSEYKVRERLLQIGRERQGTHFIFLDADETFSSNIKPHELREKMKLLKPGGKIFLQWVPLWKTAKEFRQDDRGIFEKTFKDFIFCDDNTSHHEYVYIGVGRTPGKNDDCTYIDSKDGVVLHFQFIAWKRNEYKQAWYKCSELINGQRTARRINATYQHLLTDKKAKKIKTPDNWIDDILLPEKDDLDKSNTWYIESIRKIFDIHGIIFFEPLEIWHIDELRQMFIEKTGRKPVPKTFPIFILRLNDLKNKIKNKIQKR